MCFLLLNDFVAQVEALKQAHVGDYACRFACRCASLLWMLPYLQADDAGDVREFQSAHGYHDQVYGEHVYEELYEMPVPIQAQMVLLFVLSGI
jgi:hypothetical protein